jgi:hypothetical protein
MPFGTGETADAHWLNGKHKLPLVNPEGAVMLHFPIPPKRRVEAERLRRRPFLPDCLSCLGFGDQIAANEPSPYLHVSPSVGRLAGGCRAALYVSCGVWAAQ